MYTSLSSRLPGRNRNRRYKSLIQSNRIRNVMKPLASETEKISFCPNGYYDENMDIRNIDQYVREFFSDQRDQIPEIDRQIQKTQHTLDTQILKVIHRKNLNSQIQKLELEKSEILSDRNYQEYLNRIQPLLEEWDRILEMQGPYRLFGEEKTFYPEKLACIRNFIRVASDYVPLNLILKPINIPGQCPHCRNPYLEGIEGKIICENCGIYQDSLANDMDFCDLSRINAANSNDYINRETFLKGLANYQGRQQTQLPEDLAKRFDEYCEEHRTNVKNLTQETTRPIFKKLGYNDYYDDINLFLNLHLNKPLPDISEYENELIQDYDMFSQKYNEIKGSDRDSALGSQYVLYILMQRRKIPCRKEDLRLADTPNIRKNNDNMARKVFQALNWKFTDTI